MLFRKNLRKQSTLSKNSRWATDKLTGYKPDIAALNEDSDYSIFLDPETDPELCKAALRKLFHSDKYNQEDGLDEYCMTTGKNDPIS